MQAVTTIGLDIAKSVFQVHGVDAPSRAAPTSTVETSTYARGHHAEIANH